MATIYELAEEAWENDVSGAWLQGRDDGKALGIIEGELNSKIESTVNMIKELDITLSKAMSITRLPESERGRVIEELKKLRIIYKH